jgi:wyosine [tRNA(Phe)-imidazoG37] synthetase (radical SAM superfamily)
MLLSLHRGIIYGPVNSRRLGPSLGINLMPGDYKLCSFNCVYCHYGWTKKHTLNFLESSQDLPAVTEVLHAVEGAAASPLAFDFFTFSGNGEPTLHPNFPQVVDEVVRIRDRYRPAAKVALLSNSTGLFHEEVRACVSKIDLPVFKLDAGSEETFQAINRPAPGIHLARIVDLLASLEDICIQTVLVEGKPSNVGDDELKAYFQHIRRIKPREVHIYSIDRPVPKAEIVLVSPERLAEIAARGEQATGARIRPFSQRRRNP